MSDTQILSPSSEEKENSPSFIGKYRIVEKIGEGGFGEVFKVFDPDLQKHRAIKIPMEQNLDLEKALAEARRQAKISHSAVIQVHDVIEIEPGKWAIVMEYAGGGNLRERLRDKPATMEECLAWMEKLAGAMAVAHDHGLLHYDIKPENILFDDHGNIKISDFGLARQMKSEGAKLSRIMGTPEYMGPEQLDGKEDKRSEIWTLGAVFYEMLTGKVCFSGKSDQQVIKSIITAEYTPVRTHNTVIPKTVSAVVKKMLQLDPKKRYQSMAEVKEAVRMLRHPPKVTAKRTLIWVSTFLVFLMASFLVGNMYAQKNMIVDIPFFYRMGKVPDLTLPAEMARLGAEDLFDQGLKAFEENKNPLAYKIFDTIEKQTAIPDLKEKAGYMKASMAVYRFEDKDLAASEYKSFIKKYADSNSLYLPAAHYFLGQVYFEKKQYSRARKHLDLLMDKYPNSPNVSSAKAVLARIDAVEKEQQNSQLAKITGVFKAFNPNNLSSLMLTLVGIVTTVAGPLAWIMSQYVTPDGEHGGLRTNFKALMKNPTLRNLVIIVAASQILSFVLNMVSE